MTLQGWLDVALGLVSFPLGVLLVHRYSKRPARYRAKTPAAAPAQRPAAQLPVRGYEELLQATATEQLVASIARRTRLSAGNWTRDCEPALRAFAEFVQELPASECHHHAQPGGLWIHALEVVDAALTFRTGAELPPGVSTEDRKRLEHRWTYAVFAAALLHDVGKPVTDVRVTLFGADPRLGQRWAPISGSMRASGASWYSVGFGEPDEKEYRAHAKLPAMLLQSFVPGHVLRWLGEDGDVLDSLVSYLMGEDPDGVLGAIVKRADSDSVRRNLLQGPRTRFASARSVPLIDRLMEALRRMLVDGGQLPLNRPGAAGWVHDGKVWFVCARLADEVRGYLAAHESPAGIPGKDRNDRMFDTWQEFGAALPAPDGGAVWRVRIECDGWSPPDPLTVLCFPVSTVFEPGRPPSAMNGRVVPVDQVAAAHAPAEVPRVELSSKVREAAAAPPTAQPAAPSAAAVQPSAPAEANRPPASAPAALEAAAVALPGEAPAPPKAAPAVQLAPVQLPVTRQTPARSPAPAATAEAPLARTEPTSAGVLAAALPPQLPPPATPASRSERPDQLTPEESASLEASPRVAATPELGAPMRPKERGKQPAESVAPRIAASLTTRRTPTPAATAFMAWVAQSVGTGELSYNQEGAMVHFVPEGALLLSPEIFRRFFSVCKDLQEGPIADLRASHGDRAFARLQNELAKSGWTVRNGDENLHYYVFVKADGAASRIASFYLIGRPQLFWNPVPAPNERIRLAQRPKKMVLPGSAPALEKRVPR
ncbi:MAG: MobH family relaxase [Rubrivivax sp.]